jgi:nucleotide-binding universal stress UspA family protein
VSTISTQTFEVMQDGCIQGKRIKKKYGKALKAKTAREERDKVEREKTEGEISAWEITSIAKEIEKAYDPS